MLWEGSFPINPSRILEIRAGIQESFDLLGVIFSLSHLQARLFPIWRDWGCCLLLHKIPFIFTFGGVTQGTPRCHLCGKRKGGMRGGISRRNPFLWKLAFGSRCHSALVVSRRWLLSSLTPSFFGFLEMEGDWKRERMEIPTASLSTEQWLRRGLSEGVGEVVRWSQSWRETPRHCWAHGRGLITPLPWACL